MKRLSISTLSHWHISKLFIGTLAYCLIVTLFSACTDEDKTASSGDGVAVSFSLSGIGCPSTRATAGKPLADGTTVRVLAYHRPDGSASAALSAANYAGEATYVISSGGTTLNPCTVDDRGTVTSTSGQPMQLLTGAYDFFTVTPALVATHTGDAPVVSVANGTDYASSTTGNQIISPAGENRGQTVTLEKLNRRCARLNFTIQCDETVNTITGIEVDELKLTGLSETPLQTAAMTEQAGVLLPAGDFTLTLNGADLPTDATNAKRATGSVIVLPKADAALGLSMQLCFNGSILPTVFDEVTIPAMAFEAGREYPLTITLSHGGAVTLTIGSAQLWGDGGDQNQPDAGFLPGITVGMPDWTLDEQNQGLGTIPNLSREGTANCYLVPNEADKYYAFDATVMGNGATTPADVANTADIIPTVLSPASAVVLWEQSDPTGAANTAGDVVKSVSFSNGYIHFTTGTKPGNAVIAALDGGGNIIWSWHIWRPEANPGDVECYTPKNGGRDFKMMALNLGALNNEVNDVKAYGLLYQWGRKDPFPGATEVNPADQTVAAYEGVVTENGYSFAATDISSTTITVANAVAAPMSFYSNGSRGDWISVQQDNLWGNPSLGSKSIYDPCPLGYRVAPLDTWGQHGYDSDWATNGLNLKVGKNGAKYFYPAAGRRDDSYMGRLAYVGSDGNYWSSSPYSSGLTGGGYLYFNGGYVTPENGYYRAGGMSVRCVKG